MTDLKDVWSVFDQVTPVVSYFGVRLPEKPLNPNIIGEALKDYQKQFQKEALLVKYDNNKYFKNILSTITIKYLPDETKVLRSLVSTSIKEGKCSDQWKFFYATVKMGVIGFKLLIFISPADQWHMLNNPESTLISRIFMD